MGRTTTTTPKKKLQKMIVDDGIKKSCVTRYIVIIFGAFHLNICFFFVFFFTICVGYC